MSDVARALVIRCDATPATGFGHASRCAALAEALAGSGYRPMFVGSFVDEARSRLPAGASVSPDPGSPAALADLARSAGASAIVVDGYGFDSGYFAALAPRRTGIALIAIDDFASISFPPESLVINFTLGAEQLDYPGEALTVLRGPDYTLLRSSVLAAKHRARPPSNPARAALVSVGALDPERAIRIVTALRASGDLKITIVGGEWESDTPGVAVIPRSPTLGPSLAEADLCVVGGGLTKYEAVYLGRPSAVLSRSVSEEADTRLFAKRGLVHDLGRLEAVDGATLETRVRKFSSDLVLHRRLSAAARSFFRADPASRVGYAVDSRIRTGLGRGTTSEAFDEATGRTGSSAALSDEGRSRR